MNRTIPVHRAQLASPLEVAQSRGPCRRATHQNRFDLLPGFALLRRGQDQRARLRANGLCLSAFDCYRTRGKQERDTHASETLEFVFDLGRRAPAKDDAGRKGVVGERLHFIDSHRLVE